MSRQQLVDLTWIHSNLHEFILRYGDELGGDPEMRVRLEVADDLILACMEALKDE